MREVREEEETKQTYSTVDSSSRFPGDIDFRKNGFFIHSRPTNGLVLWTTKEGIREGHTWTEEEVMEMIFKKERAPE